jgi:hypothetical protein
MNERSRIDARSHINAVSDAESTLMLVIMKAHVAVCIVGCGLLKLILILRYGGETDDLVAQNEKNGWGRKPPFFRATTRVSDDTVILNTYIISRGCYEGKTFIFLLITPVILDRFFSNLHHCLSRYFVFKLVYILFLKSFLFIEKKLNNRKKIKIGRSPFRAYNSGFRHTI